jgi:hypothetical protein
MPGAAAPVASPEGSIPGYEPATRFSMAGGASSAGPFVLTRSRGGRAAVRTTRPTVRPNRKNGATTIVFRLAKATVVRFTIVRVHPTCERVGSFRVRAHAGVNRVRFGGRLKGRPLEEGTYRLVVRARGAGADAAALRLVVDRGEPLSGEELAEARNANVCGTSGTAAGATIDTALGWSPTPGGPEGAREGGTAGASGDDGIGVPVGAGTIGRGAAALGARFATALEDPNAIHPLVWAALALSVLLLGVAAVPPAALTSARAEAIYYRRFEIALAGTAALGAAFLMYLIS